MRVLLLHNRYQQPGGEDQVFAAERDLLEAHGHRVTTYTLHNDRISGMSKPALVKATVWNQAAYRDLRALIRREAPQVAHFHNTFPLISPAAYYAAHSEGVPVVQTLHNYRLLCPDALFFRAGRVCEDCLGKRLPWPGVAHACYRGSRTSSAAVATMLTAHRALGTWGRAVDAYVALTGFAREKFVQGGLPAGKITVKPNFVHPDPGMGGGGGDYFLFVGRLSHEKGVEVMLSAWEALGGAAKLRIVGDGPLASRVEAAAGRSAGVEWLGRQPKGRVLELMKDAKALLFPSTWYEGFPMVIAEAYAVGLPVIASELGGMASLIEHGETGLHFRPGDAGSLADRVRRAAADPAELGRMRSRARKVFEDEYSAEPNYRIMTAIYERAEREYRRPRTDAGGARAGRPTRNHA